MIPVSWPEKREDLYSVTLTVKGPDSPNAFTATGHFDAYTIRKYLRDDLGEDANVCKQAVSSMLLDMFLKAAKYKAKEKP